MKFKIRKHIFSATDTFSLQENELTIVNDKQQNVRNSIRYKDVRTVNLLYTPGYQRVPDAYQCTLTTTSGKSVKIGSNHLVSFGNIETKYQEYATFIKLLHQKLAKNSSVEFTKGLNNSQFIAIRSIFGFLLLVLIGIGIFGIFKGELKVGVIMLLGSIFFGYFFYKLYRSYSPENYSPDHIPTEMLPKNL